MKPLFRQACFVALMCMAFAMLQCSSLQSTAFSGTGSETIIGRIVNEDGSPAGATAVTLLPYNYDPVSDPPLPESCSDTTDENGAYAIMVNAPFAPQYQIQAVHLAVRTKALMTGIELFLRSDTTVVSAGTLHNTGRVKVILSDTSAVANGYIYIPGTTLRTMAENGNAVIDSVPAGLIPALNYINTSDTAKNHVIRTNVTVVSGQTTVIADLQAWKYSKKIFFNTTRSGADVAVNVKDFPVLVRLSESNFVFSQAQSDGRDIRFSKSDNTPLAYEIERWDASSQEAEIWVKVDTVYGNDTAHFISMYWGNPDAVSQSNSSDVFDTSVGFQGVWHMNETGTHQAKDATSNHYDGTPSTPAPVGVPGLIGVSQKFNGVSNFIMMNGTANSRLNFPVNGYYTVSAWVNLDSTLGVYKVFISKGYTQYTLQINSRNSFEISEFHNGLGWEYSSAPAAAKAWKYVIGVREGTNQYLYIDGVMATSTIVNDSSTSRRYTGDELIMGTASGGTRDFLNGLMDELSISSVSRGSNWIKLCYMNQRADDKLIQMK
jgi:hypothetical protein